MCAVNFHKINKKKNTEKLLIALYLFEIISSTVQFIGKVDNLCGVWFECSFYGNSAKIGLELRNDFLIKKVVLFLAAVGSIFKKRTKVCCI